MVNTNPELIENVNEINSYETLKKLGLTLYETRCYELLIQKMYFTASEIAEHTNIPRPKVYHTLNLLIQKGWVDKIQGKPIRFRARPPSETLGEEKKKFTEKINDTLSTFQEMWDNKEEIATDPIQLIHGTPKLEKIAFKLIREAKNHVMIFYRFLLPSEIDFILTWFPKLSKRGVVIEIFMFNDLYKNLDPVILAVMNEYTLLKAAPVPVRLQIVDSSSMIVSAPGIVGTEIDESVTSNVYFRTTPMITLIQQSLRFSMQHLIKQQPE